MSRNEITRLIILSHEEGWRRAIWSDSNTIDGCKITFWGEGAIIRNKRLRYIINKVYEVKSLALKRYKKHRYLYKFRGLWQWVMINNLNIKRNERSLAIIYDWNWLSIDDKFIKTLSKKCQIIYLFTNICNISGAQSYKLNLHELPFSKILTYDEGDSKKYKMTYCPLPYLVDPSTIPSRIESFDLFYIGNAKDRCSQIIEIFEKAKAKNLRCKFFINGVDSKDQKYGEEIIYNQELSYEEVLCYIKSCKCIVEFIQRNSTGFTLRVPEAIIFNKKLITNNKNLLQYPFFKKNKIAIISEELDIEEFVNVETLDYDDDDKSLFSLSHFLSKCV